MVYTCKYCDRKYTRKVYFDLHENACGIMQKSDDERRFELEEHVDTLTLRKQYELLLQLANMVKKQDKQIQSLTRDFQRTQKKKLSILTWLDNNAHPRQSFEEWYSALVFDRTHLDMVLEHDHIKGMLFVLECKVPKDAIAILPVRSFKQKENVLYVFDGEKWQVMTPDQLKKFITFVSRCITKQFNNWVDENQKKIDNVQSEFSTTYLNNLYKVNGGKFTRQQIYSRIKRGLYQHLKTDLQNVIEYEVSF